MGKGGKTWETHGNMWEKTWGKNGINVGKGGNT